MGELSSWSGVSSFVDVFHFAQVLASKQLLLRVNRGKLHADIINILFKFRIFAQISRLFAQIILTWNIAIFVPCSRSLNVSTSFITKILISLLKHYFHVRSQMCYYIDETNLNNKTDRWVCIRFNLCFAP